MKAIELTEKLSGLALEFCKMLKELDSYPCSYWGYNRDSILKSINSNDKKIVVCLDNEGKVMALGTLIKGGFFQRHWAEISIAVHPYFRRKGLAKKVIEKLESFKKELGIEFIKALILENNSPSRKAFEKYGYIHKATLFQEFKIEGLGPLNDCAYYKMLI